MILLPVIARELRAEARRPFTHWLRVAGAGTLLLAGVVHWNEHSLGPGKGAALFSMLHLTLFWTIWLVVPVMTADCISREKREGTLGLLFLTPLRAREVVLAKVLAHGLRAAALALAALPLLTIPFLYGGVGWPEAVASALINFSAFCWAMGAGVVASSSSPHLTRALVLAAFWGGLFFLLFALLQGTAAFASIALSFRGWPFDDNFSWWTILENLISYGLRAMLDFEHLWSSSWMRGGPASFSSGWVNNLALVAVVSFLAQWLVLMLAARNVRRLWQDKSPSPRQEKLEQQFCTPRFGQSLFRRWMRRLLERNPVGWLERRTWRSRLVMWGWLAVMIAFYSVALGNPLGYARELEGVQAGVVLTFLTSIAMSAAGSFRRERETGLLELMLVTPLRVGQIVNGRLRALWGQFLPASILFVTLWVLVVRAFTHVGMSPGQVTEHEIWLWLFCSSALTLPVVGLWCSLHCRLFIVSLFGTIVGGFVLPLLLVAAFTRWMGEGLVVLNSGLFLALLATLGWALVCRRPSLRDYAGALLAPILTGICGALAILFITDHRQAMMIEDDSQASKGLLSLLAVQLIIAVALLLLLHRALARRKFAFPQ